MKVRFPIYIQAVVYQEIELPDYVDHNNEEEVRDFLYTEWDSVPLPDNTEWEYYGDYGIDLDAPIEIINDKGETIN